MRSTLIRCVGVGLVFVLITAGCGDDSGDDAGDSAGFVADLDQICMDLRDQLQTLQVGVVPIDPESDLAELSEPLQQVGEAYQTAADEADGLTPPEDLQDPYDRFVASMRDLADVSEEMAEAAADEDPEAMNEVADTAAAEDSEDPEAIADELGLTCFEPGVTADDAGAAAQEYCDRVAEHVDAVDTYIADPTSADPLTLSTQGIDLAEEYADLAAEADAEDQPALRACADQLVDTALALSDAVQG